MGETVANVEQSRENANRARVVWGQYVSTGFFCNRFVTVWLIPTMHAEDCCGVRCATSGGQSSSSNSEDGRVTHNTIHSVQSTEQGANLDAAH